MVLDDLGLVPTLRRAARERGRRAGVPVEFDSLGPERRLPMDLESGLFRILDEAMAAYLVRAGRAGLDPPRLGRAARGARRRHRGPPPRHGRTRPRRSPADKDLPPALAAMMEDRRADARDAIEAARREAIVVLPPSTWREIQGRAATPGHARRAVGRRRRAAPGRGPAGRDRPGRPPTSRDPRMASAMARRERGQGLVEYGLILALTTHVHGRDPRRLRWDACGLPRRHRVRDRRRDGRLTRRSVRVDPPYHQPSSRCRGASLY